MKNIKSCLLIILAIISFNSFAQKLSFTDLKGEWSTTDTTNGNNITAVFNFTSDSELILNIKNGSLINVSLPTKYKLDTTRKVAVLTIESHEFGIITHTGSMLIRLVGKDTLKIQDVFNYGTSVPLGNGKSALLSEPESGNMEWKETENVHNTGILIRIKNN